MAGRIPDDQRGWNPLFTDPRFRSPTTVGAPQEIAPFLETIWFDSESYSEKRLERNRVWGRQAAIKAVGGMSDEAKRFDIRVKGRVMFEGDFVYLGKLWPNLHTLPVSILVDGFGNADVEIRLYGPIEKMRAGIVLSGTCM